MANFSKTLSIFWILLNALASGYLSFVTISRENIYFEAVPIFLFFMTIALFPFFNRNGIMPWIWMCLLSLPIYFLSMNLFFLASIAMPFGEGLFLLTFSWLLKIRKLKVILAFSGILLFLGCIRDIISYIAYCRGDFESSFVRMVDNPCSSVFVWQLVTLIALYCLTLQQKIDQETVA